MNAVEFYKRLLESLGLTYNEDQNTFHVNSDSKRAVTVDKLKIALPTKEALATYNDNVDEIMIYHPSHENVLKRDSKTLSFTHRAIQANLYADYITILSSLIRLSADTDKHAGLNKAQRDIISRISGADDKLYNNLESIFDNLSPHKQPRAIDITIQRGNSTSGASRIGKVKWCLYEAILEATNSIMGVKVRKNDIKILKAVHEILFENRPARLIPITETSQQVITNEQIAPSFRVLLELYHDVKYMLICLYKPFEDIFPPISSMDLEWEAYLGDLKNYRNKIPSFPGNEGESPIKAKSVDIPTDYTTPSAISKPQTSPVREIAPTPAQTRPIPHVNTAGADDPLTPEMFATLTEYNNAVTARNLTKYGQPQQNVRGAGSYYNNFGVEVQANRYGHQQPDIDYSNVGGAGYGAPAYTRGQSQQYVQPTYQRGRSGPLQAMQNLNSGQYGFNQGSRYYR